MSSAAVESSCPPKRARFARLRLAVLVAGSLLGAAASAQPTPDGFLCCNLRSDGSWISDSNYAVSGKHVLPLGTPVRVTGYGRYRVYVTLDGTKQAIGNDYSRSLDMTVFMQRYVVEVDPRQRAANFAPRIQQAIQEGKIVRGMTREQVLMAMGYPMHSYNPVLEAPSWKYWYTRSNAYEVMFDNAGRVKEVVADEGTLEMMMLK